MASLLEYICYNWRRRFATTAEEKFPAQTERQNEYRKVFNIIDQYLIYYSMRKIDGKLLPHKIVYIDAENDVDWDINDDAAPEEEKYREMHQYITKLDLVHMLPVQNLSPKEVLNFKKMVGAGYAAAINGNWEEADKAMESAKRYRDDRNKESSRFMLMGCATICLILIGIAYAIYICCTECHHINGITGVLMGSVGAYVSIWTRYGKMDMTGLGAPKLHYLEAASRMAIGAIFALIILCLFKSGIIFYNIAGTTSLIYVYCVFGFCAGFSEQLVPSLLERFIVDKAQANDAKSNSSTNTSQTEK